MMKTELTRIILVRHGQTKWNRVERFRGRIDVHLDKSGRAQAQATGKKVATTWKVAAIFSSPLSRAMETAAAISLQIHLVQGVDIPVQPYPGMLDIDYGEWGGLTPEEARERWPEDVDAWYNNPQMAVIPGGEGLDSVRQRIMGAVTELSRQYVGKTILLLGHTVINRVLLLGILGLGNELFWRLKQDTCAINVFETMDRTYTLVSFNDTCHLHE